MNRFWIYNLLDKNLATRERVLLTLISNYVMQSSLKSKLCRHETKSSQLSTLVTHLFIPISCIHSCLCPLRAIQPSQAWCQARFLTQILLVSAGCQLELKSMDPECPLLKRCVTTELLMCFPKSTNLKMIASLPIIQSERWQLMTKLTNSFISNDIVATAPRVTPASCQPPAVVACLWPPGT